VVRQEGARSVAAVESKMNFKPPPNDADDADDADDANKHDADAAPIYKK